MRNLVFFLFTVVFLCSSPLALAQESKAARSANELAGKKPTREPGMIDEQISLVEWKIDKLSREISGKLKEVNQALSNPDSFDEESFKKTYMELKDMASKRYDEQLNYIILMKKANPGWTPAFKGGVWKVAEKKKKSKAGKNDEKTAEPKKNKGTGSKKKQTRQEN